MQANFPNLLSGNSSRALPTKGKNKPEFARYAADCEIALNLRCWERARSITCAMSGTGPIFCRRRRFQSRGASVSRCHNHQWRWAPLPVFCGGLPAFSPLFGYLFGTVYATPHSELRRALGNQAHRGSQYPSACPVPSRTMKWASVFSPIQDGGKRRGLISSSLFV
jgi:hypothetical protein